MLLRESLPSPISNNSSAILDLTTHTNDKVIDHHGMFYSLCIFNPLFECLVILIRHLHFLHRIISLSKKKARHIIAIKTVMTCLTLLYRIIF